VIRRSFPGAIGLTRRKLLLRFVHSFPQTTVEVEIFTTEVRESNFLARSDA
jgi:hypothetical protein